MLRFLTHSEIDFARWDACLHASAENILYATARYLEISTNGNWAAIVEFSEAKYVSVFPLPIKNRLGIPVIYQPFITQQLGLFTTSESKFRNPENYVAHIPKSFRKIYLQLNTENTAVAGSFPAEFNVLPRQNFHLNLAETYETLRANYSTNLKRNLKKAQQQNFTVSGSSDISALLQLFQKTRGQDLNEVKNRHYEMLQKQYEFQQKSDRAAILEVRENDVLIAGALFLNYGGKLIFLFSAVAEPGKKAGAMPLIIDSMIQKHAGTACMLDFEGGSIPNLQRFYSSFGAKSVTYLSVSKNTLPWYFKWLIK